MSQPVRITEAHWQALAAVMRKQTDNARCLGIARWEYLKAVAALGADPDRFQLGQALYEYQQHEAFLMAAIQRAEAEQQQAGEQALLSAGLNPADGEYTIAQGGVVLQLVEGTWHPVMPPESSVHGVHPHRHLHCEAR